MPRPERTLVPFLLILAVAYVAATGGKVTAVFKPPSDYVVTDRQWEVFLSSHTEINT